MDLKTEGKGQEGLCTHVKLLMYPDGGIARFRLYGEAVPVFPLPNPHSSHPPQQIDLAAALNGAIAQSWSDQHFGRASNLLLPGRGKDMRDGWETKRSRTKGHVDWVVVRLADRGRVNSCVVDTLHFRGNFPRCVEVWGRDEGAEGAGKGQEEGEEWRELGRIEQCEKDKEHEVEVGDVICTHVKMVMIPDGGVKRLRVWGTRAE